MQELPNYQNTPPPTTPANQSTNFAWAPVVAAGVGGLAGLFQGRANRRAAAKENQLNREYQERMRNQQNEFNLEQWMRNNQYSSPKEQMARLREAGLNPNLVYGSGAGQTQAAPQVKASTAAASNLRVPPSQVGKVASDSLSAYMQMAQIENVRENTEAIKLANIEKSQDLGETAGNKDNVLYTKRFNEAVKSAEEALTAYELRKLAGKNVTAQELRNHVLKLESEMAGQGILRGQNPWNQLINIIINLLGKSGINLSDITSNVIRKQLPQ